MKNLFKQKLINMARENLNNMADLLIYELRDLYSAETQLVEALPKMAQAASNEKLKKAFQDHLDETRKQKSRLDEISKLLDEDLNGSECKAMKGLISEGEEIIKADGRPEVKDAAIIGAAQRIEHYEIAAYGTVINFADHLSEDEISDLLSETLKEEKEADSKLNRLATKSINVRAEAVS